MREKELFGFLSFWISFISSLIQSWCVEILHIDKLWYYMLSWSEVCTEERERGSSQSSDTRNICVICTGISAHFFFHLWHLLLVFLYLLLNFFCFLIFYHVVLVFWYITPWIAIIIHIPPLSLPTIPPLLADLLTSYSVHSIYMMV